jgi:Kef-type K+ transport system membrane component KefB
MLFMLAVWFTDSIGIHAVFGGFLLGIAMPRGLFARELQRQLEPFAVVFLLPMFFTFSGLNTRLDMVNTQQLFLIALAIIAAACLGKGGACWAAARLSGEDNRTALAVGTLMNARGLMELIIINIGLQKGVIQPALFSIMVLMAIVTTLMTAPVFEWVYGRHSRKLGVPDAAPAEA